VLPAGRAWVAGPAAKAAGLVATATAVAVLVVKAVRRCQPGETPADLEKVLPPTGARGTCVGDAAAKEEGTGARARGQRRDEMEAKARSRKAGARREGAERVCTQ